MMTSLHPLLRRSRIGSEVVVRDASVALRDLCRAVSDVESTLARGLGLSAGEYRAVKHVLYAPQPLGVTALAAHLGYSKGTTSELIVRLESRGFLEREPSATDGRRVAVRATDHAVSEVHASLGAMFGALAGAARAHDASTLRAVTGFLRDAAAAVRI